MILPTKGISTQRCLLTVGAEALQILGHANTPSAVWEEFHQRHKDDRSPVGFEWFMLALTFLYAAGLIDYGTDKDMVRRANVPARDRV